MSWTAIGAFVLDQAFGYSSANKLRANAIALASARLTYHLGGSRSVAIPMVAAAQDAIDYLDIELDGTNLAGFTISLRVECRTSNAGTSVTPKLRNVTDGTDAATGAACSATTFGGANGTQSITATIAAGVKKYRLMATPSNTTNPVFIIGYLEIWANA